jgi:hypothetical protein
MYIEDVHDRVIQLAISQALFDIMQVMCVYNQWGCILYIYMYTYICIYVCVRMQLLFSGSEAPGQRVRSVEESVEQVG